MFAFSAHSLTLKMEIGRSSETLVNFCQTTRRHIPQDTTFTIPGNSYKPDYKRKVQVKDAGFEVFPAVVMKPSVFWDITPYSSLKVNRRFGGICRLHLQGGR
jgi:hypothetical protein